MTEQEYQELNEKIKASRRTILHRIPPEELKPLVERRDAGKAIRDKMIYWKGKVIQWTRAYEQYHEERYKTWMEDARDELNKERKNFLTL